ncbi:MAG: hypothetical protein J6B32_08295 [Spirochaetaceae bacterium]|nr:hypothetical protein [Spirochaetaceae bacterium]
MYVAKRLSNKLAREAKVRELQQKVQDQEYMEAAIQRIALVLSRKLVENNSNMRTQ